MLPDEPTSEEQLQELPEDPATPFQPADPSPSDTGTGGVADLPDDHPATDTNIDPHELYDEGVAGAAEVEDPSATDPAIEDIAL